MTSFRRFVFPPVEPSSYTSICSMTVNRYESWDRWRYPTSTTHRTAGIGETGYRPSRFSADRAKNEKSNDWKIFANVLKQLRSWKNRSGRNYYSNSRVTRIEMVRFPKFRSCKCRRTIIEIGARLPGTPLTPPVTVQDSHCRRVV